MLNGSDLADILIIEGKVFDIGFGDFVGSMCYLVRLCLVLILILILIIACRLFAIDDMHCMHCSLAIRQRLAACSTQYEQKGAATKC